MVINNSNNKKGFTLIEIIIVISVISILLPTIFATVYMIVQQQLRIYRITETKRQGDYVSTVMKELISREVIGFQDDAGLPLCFTSGSSATAVDGSNFNFIASPVAPSTNNQLFGFIRTGSTIQLEIGTVIAPAAITTDLTNTRVAVTNFIIACNKKSDSTLPLVAYEFDILFIDSTPTNSEGIVSLHYQSKVKIRRTAN
ncbi:hypothetical protein COV58_00860 [Candidatus Roizmanbacteria bacterium CG11_big_fil_rev_8_21_14_0_20_36_8]|uniref:Prepilin-type N-terminal cleavage/methylation domain-containing protein n=2 Tax=Candidatus Roizmaniibacteriota TaxID=1752723 RepID=A0A2M6IUY6_9BACT|nr:MAG: hypothetical protein COV58_00860 [Candidatus Roizmanbacteria bacterium CG11_big_fil_rev_8_21_14_0_20_36_8]PIZ66046.1 MAG: hypothetical protein COY14_01200 [Candidatus Roizmanbacteria bacterium CG_4_10_14_0_2_um_filter_36_9]